MANRIVLSNEIDAQYMKAVDVSAELADTSQKIKTILDQVKKSFGRSGGETTIITSCANMTKAVDSCAAMFDEGARLLDASRTTYRNLDQAIRQEVNNKDYPTLGNLTYGDQASGQGSYEDLITDAIAAEMGDINNGRAPKYWSWYYGYESSRSDSWCAVFCSYMLAMAGIDTKAPVNAGCRWFETSPAYQKNYFDSIGIMRQRGEYTPKTGDLVYYADCNGNIVHVGLVTSVDNGVVQTLQGNVGSPTILALKETNYRDTNGECHIAGYADIGAFAAYQHAQQ